MKITIGKVEKSHLSSDQTSLFGVKSGSKVSIDLKILKQTRLLMTADSGGGKTYAIKKIVEEAFGKIPIHIIDPEGEFGPLRELFDFFLIAKGADSPPTVSLARAQAQKFLEIRASVILDIYELKPSDRHLFVREYIEGLMEAPKATRHPCLVIVDEAHIFAPESGKSEAAEAMADLASRGRKRGLILIVATQRLAKLNKDVTSEMLNRLIGPTFEDVNRERAARVLGITKAHEREFYDQIKLLEPGHFFALGRAISKDLIRVKIDPIKSKHGEAAEKYNTSPPPARAKIAALLKEIKEIPAEQERKAETAREFREQLRNLRTELYQAKHATPAPAPTIDPKRFKRELQAAVKRADAKARSDYGASLAVLKGSLKVMDAAVKSVIGHLRRIADEVLVTAGHAEGLLSKAAKNIASPKVAKFDKSTTDALLEMAVVASKELPQVSIHRSEAKIPLETERIIHKKGKTVETKPMNLAQEFSARNGDSPALSKSQIKILKAINSIREMSGDETPERSKVAFWSGASVTSSTFSNNISELKVAGYLSYPNSGAVAMADESAKHDPRFAGIMLSADTLRARQNELLSSSQTAMLDFIRSKYPADVSKEDLCAAVGAASIKSSTFANNISELKTAGLITYPRSGFVKLESWLEV